MNRKQCQICGKWEITDKIVQLGGTWCSECYHIHKSTIGFPENGKISIIGGNCYNNKEFSCYGGAIFSEDLYTKVLRHDPFCPKFVECINKQIRVTQQTGGNK